MMCEESTLAKHPMQQTDVQKQTQSVSACRAARCLLVLHCRCVSDPATSASLVSNGRKLLLELTFARHWDIGCDKLIHYTPVCCCTVDQSTIIWAVSPSKNWRVVPVCHSLRQLEVTSQQHASETNAYMHILVIGQKYRREAVPVSI